MMCGSRPCRSPRQSPLLRPNPFTDSRQRDQARGGSLLAYGWKWGQA